MTSFAIAKEIMLNNILYLTDFSQSAEAALPFVTAIARQYASTVYAAHILLPDVYACMAPEFGHVVHEGLEQAAKGKMQRIESQLAGLRHESVIVRGTEVWTALQPVMQKNRIDLVVLGTHGRTGVQKLLLGSVAEEIWRRSRVPVLTIGPAAIGPAEADGRFKSILFATDFTPESVAGFPYACSMARENHARLTLLHVIRQFAKREILGEQAGVEAALQLNAMLPCDAESWCLPELVVRYGKPAEQIIELAHESRADLIVLGIRESDGFGIACHARGTTAHDMVVNASCPVLTVRGQTAADFRHPSPQPQRALASFDEEEISHG